jgi:hypothetical protein
MFYLKSNKVRESFLLSFLQLGSASSDGYEMPFGNSWRFLT